MDPAVWFLLFVVVCIVCAYGAGSRSWWGPGAMRAAPPRVFEVWAGFAKEKGLHLAPPGARIEARTPFLSGSVGAVAVELSIVPEHEGERREFTTRLAMRAATGLEVHLRLERRSGPTRSGLAAFQTGDDVFDDAFRATADDPIQGGRLLDESVRGALLTVSSHPRIEVDYAHGNIELTWDGGESDPERLDRALAAGLALCHWRRAAVGYR